MSVCADLPPPLPEMASESPAQAQAIYHALPPEQQQLLGHFRQLINDPKRDAEDE